MKKPPVPLSPYDAIIDDIDRVVGELNVKHHELTLGKYLELGSYSRDVIASHGGLPRIIRDAFGPYERAYTVLHAQRTRANYVKKLERVAGSYKTLADRIVTNLVEAYTHNPPPVQKNLKPVAIGKTKNKRRANVAFISDTHWGLKIDKNEVPANAHDWTIASRRMAKFAHQIATYKQEHRADSQELYLCLGGDLCQGIIHLSESGTDLLTIQLHGAHWILMQMIEYLRGHYKRIHVKCTTDNHMRMIHKGPDRATHQKWDSFATVLHLMLQASFRNAKDVDFQIPKTPYTEFDVLGHSVFLTHGDTVLRSGYVSKSVPIGKITNDVRALQAQHMNKPLNAVMMGHVHVPLNTTLDNGVELIINGTGSGTDAYAQSLGIMNSNPCQVLFEATEDYVVGDFRKVFLRDADDNLSYDKVIIPYDGSLKLP